MIITPVQLPPIPHAAPLAQTLNTVLPQVQAQAVAPISQQALTPATPTERGQRTKDRSKERRNKDRPVPEEEERRKRGGHINISV